MKEREDPADCLDNDLQQIFGSVISPDLEIMKQEEEKLEGHCRSLLCFVCSTQTTVWTREGDHAERQQ